MAINNVSKVLLYGGGSHTFTNVLTSVTAEGKCEQNGTPSPDNPVPIVCNNGTISVNYQPGLPPEISVTGTQEVLTDGIGNTTACDNLFGVGTYKDTQDVISGVVTRNIGVKVLDGTENWTAYNGGMYFALGGGSGLPATDVAYCSHFSYAGSNILIVNLPMGSFTIATNGNCSFKSSNTTTKADWVAWLASQYAAGTPVIIVYPLATATTETSNKGGLLRAPVTVTSGSLSDLVVNTTTGNRVISYGTYANCPTITDVDTAYTDWVNNSMYCAFIYSNNLTTVTNLSNNVTNMVETFYGCTSLVDAPAIPTSVTNMSGTFSYCTNLVNAPVIPNSVTDMYRTFWNCTNLVDAPAIPNVPNSYVDLVGTFGGCTNLVNAPVIPTSVSRMVSTFSRCSSLTNAPTIPNSVYSMDNTFSYCTNLINAPIIPNSVTQISNTFRDCINLTGDIYVQSSGITWADNCFNGTSLPKNVHVPANSTTYNSFVAAGYDDQGTKEGVTLIADL